MYGRAFIAILLGLMLFLGFGYTAAYRNEGAAFPAPPEPPQPPMGAKAKGETRVFTVPVQKNVIIPDQPTGSLLVVSVKPNSKRSNDTTFVSAPERLIPINDSDAILADAFQAQHPERLQVYFFYSPLCPYSLRVKPNVTLQEERFANTTEWHTINVLEPEGFAFFEKTIREKGLSKPDMVVPIIFAGKHKLVGLQEIEQLLQKILQDAAG